VVDLQDEKKGLEQDLADSRRRCETLEDSLLKVQKASAEQVQEKRTAESKLQELAVNESVHLEEQQEMAQMLANALQEIDQSNTALLKTQDEVRRLKNDLSTRSSDFAAEQKLRQQQELELSSLREEVQVLRSTADSATAELNVSHSRVEDMELQLQSIEAQCDSWKRRARDLQEELAVRDKTTHRLSQEVKDLAHRIEAMTDDRKASEQHRQQLAELLQDRTRAVAEQEQTIAKQSKEMEQCLLLVAELQSQIEQLQLEKQRQRSPVSYASQQYSQPSHSYQPSPAGSLPGSAPNSARSSVRRT
jgi:chromosome segregation ATPase